MPLLGICLGMQLLALSGDEDGPSNGLGWIKGEVKRFEFADPSIKIPHVGFNRVEFATNSGPLFKGLGIGADFYFVHSYRLVGADPGDITAFVEYGERFAVGVQIDNVFGTQFHPEKSQSNGLKLLRNFLSLKL